MSRIIARFSGGAPSAVMTKLLIARHGLDAVEVVFSDTRSEDEDNARFRRDCEQWFGKECINISSDKYADVWDVWERERFISNHKGAPCTGMLKREPMFAWQRPDDILALGYSFEKKEQERANRFEAVNFERECMFPLIEARLTKPACKALVERAGIKLPRMYDLGFHNANCPCCPKGGMGYWNMLRTYFPANFKRMAALQRELGPGSAFLKRGETRITLDELDPSWGNHKDEPDIECSIECHIAEQDMAA